MEQYAFSAFGDYEQWELRRLPAPAPGDHELLVAIRAAALNPLDEQIIRGDYHSQTPLPYVPGHDAAGVVVRAGRQVARFREGDEVYYVKPLFEGDGTFATHHLVDERYVAHKPAALAFTEAAAIALTGTTAWYALAERAGLQPGSTILIHAGSGGVGSIAIRMAAYLGATVITVAREQHAAALKALGATHVIDRSEDVNSAVLALTGGRGVDVVLDTAGGHTIEAGTHITAPGGKIVSIVDTAAPQNLLSGWQHNIDIQLVFVPQRAALLEQLTQFVAATQFRPFIQAVFPAGDMAAAFAALQQPGKLGKIVVNYE